MKSLIFFVCIAAAYGAVEEIPILHSVNDINEDGNFQYAYETGNGILADAKGSLKNAGVKDAEALSVVGTFSYTGPDGVKYSVSYVADENGYNPQGDHLPTPPPIPEYIQKSLDWNAAHPQPEAGQISSRH